MIAMETGEGNAVQRPLRCEPDTACEWLARLWLARFANKGGWWVVGADGRVSFGRLVEGYSIAENASAAALWSDLQRDPDKLGTIRDYLRCRHRGALLATQAARA